MDALNLNKLKTLFSMAYNANIATLIVGMCTILVFYFANQTKHLNWFFSVLLISIIIRLYLTQRASRAEDKELQRIAYYYVIAGFFIGIDFALLNVMYFDLQNNDLRIFLTVLSFGIITAAIGSLAIWMTAYLTFVLPQIISLIALYYLNESSSISLIIVIFAGFIISIAKKFNDKFVKEQLLILENVDLISKMETEITNRKSIQAELEKQQQELENTVRDRTTKLVSINDDLKQQINLRTTAEKELEIIAYYDDLTGLPNRSLFQETLKKTLSQAKRNKSLLSVLFVDLDRFKNINDSYGHLIGDKLLKCVSERLKETLRDSDYISRNSSDEFCVLIEDMQDMREPFVVAKKITKAINKRFEIDELSIHLGVCIGISAYPLDANESLDLLEMADTAMYEAKKIGTNNFQFYSSAMSDRISDRLRFENALRDALSQNEFFLVYQPQVDIRTNETIGFEALLRWDSKEFGFVSPIDFIPILEESGLIYSVGDWIIIEVLKFIKSGKSNNAKVSINLSALQCSSKNFSTKIKEFIEESCVDPSLVEFEITESLLIDDFDKTEIFLSEISKLGCTIALDDFGTGYTSFGYLAKLPIDVIKIDKSFVTDIHIDKNLENIVYAIVTMSNGLGLKNVFEGVETYEELEIIKSMNGSVIQGFYFSKPLLLSDIDDWFDKKLEKSSL